MFILSSNDSYLRHPKLLHHPRSRLLFVIALIVVVVSIRSVLIVSGFCLFLLLAVLQVGVQFRFLVKRFLLVFPFAVGALILMPFSVRGSQAFEWFGFSASIEGIHQALLVFVKICTANFLITYLVASTSTFDLFREFRSLGIPAIFIEIIHLMLRYFFLLSEEVQSMLKAQRSRGFRPDGWCWSRLTYQRFGQMLGVLFLRAYHRSKKIYSAMYSRGGFEGAQTASDATIKREIIQMKSRMAIEIQNVSFSYGATKVLKGIDLSVPAGVKVALMGPNGAGKSTLISLLNGIEKPDRGVIRIFGETLSKQNRNQLCQRLGIVFQDPDDQIFSTTVEEDVAFGPRNMGFAAEEVSDRVEMALGSVGMRAFRKSSPFELSYGQKRRVAIAGVLAMRPDIVILDEPMAFLDPKGRDDLQALLEQMHLMGMTVMVATHDVDFAAEWADLVIIMKDGEILAQGTTDLLFDDQLIEQAELHLPRLARPFRMLPNGNQLLRPKTVRQAAQIIWRMVASREELASK